LLNFISRNLAQLAKVKDIPDSTCEDFHMGGILDSTYGDIHIEDAEGQPSDVVVVATERRDLHILTGKG